MSWSSDREEYTSSRRPTILRLSKQRSFGAVNLDPILATPSSPYVSNRRHPPSTPDVDHTEVTEAIATDTTYLFWHRHRTPAHDFVGARDNVSSLELRLQFSDDDIVVHPSAILQWRSSNRNSVHRRLGNSPYPRLCQSHRYSHHRHASAHYRSLRNGSSSHRRNKGTMSQLHHSRR